MGLAAQYKLTPTFLPEAKRLEASCLVSPGAVLQGLEAETRGKVRCVNPLRSYVAPDLVPCSYRPTVATPLLTCTGSLETSITRKTELLFLCSSVEQRQIDVQTRNCVQKIS